MNEKITPSPRHHSPGCRCPSCAARGRYARDLAAGIWVPVLAVLAVMALGWALVHGWWWLLVSGLPLLLRTRASYPSPPQESTQQWYLRQLRAVNRRDDG